MRRFLILLNREVKTYFYSPTGYVVFFFFLVLSGFFFTYTVALLNKGPSETTLAEAYFSIFSLFGFIVVFPLLTMRLFAEEFKLGTIETLMTAPLKDWEVVLAKYFGALFFYFLLWLPNLLYFQIFQWITSTETGKLTGTYWPGFLVIFMIGMFYLSIGCLTSVLTKDQVVAAIISLVIISIFFYGGLFSSFLYNMTPLTREFFAYWSAPDHIESFSRGIIDTRPLIFYPSMTVLTLAVTYYLFQYRRWRT